MKIAIVYDCPSIDAQPGGFLSKWEQDTTDEMLRLAGLQPTSQHVAYRAHYRKWETLFVGKVGGDLTTMAAEDRQKLWDALAGYDIALTMGSHAMFALTGETKIDTYRGTHIDSPYVEGLQVVPTYAPYIYARLNWSERPVVVSAMKKATKRYEDRPRTIYLPETPADLYAFERQHIQKEVVFDVETNRACRITEFSLATSSAECLYVQLEDGYHKSVWSAEDELAIWVWLHRLAQRKDLAWGFHNAVYDLTYLDAVGIHPLGHIFDTMLRHHAFQPEFEKSLGFLAAMHIPSRAWKHLRKQAKKNFNKAGAL
jgi:hypothetical protein